jgi:hypothetical protein
VSALLSVIPGIGPVLSAASAAWSFLASPVGRLLVVAAIAFIGGWHGKARLDEAASLRALIAKQRIDLVAARHTADAANAVVADIAQRDARNQEIISDLQTRLSQRPPHSAIGAPANGCALDPAAVGGLRRLR